MSDVSSSGTPTSTSSSAAVGRTHKTSIELGETLFNRVKQVTEGAGSSQLEACIIISFHESGEWTTQGLARFEGNRVRGVKLEDVRKLLVDIGREIEGMTE